MGSLLVTSQATVQVGSSKQGDTGAMAGSREQLGRQGWTDRVRLQVISEVGGFAWCHATAVREISAASI